MIQRDGLKAVIFDFDGLMIESESLAHQVWWEILASYGRDLTDDIYRNLVGREPVETVDYFIETLDLPIAQPDLLETYWSERTERLCREGIPAPGLIDLVQFLRDQGMVLGVASNSPSSYVLAVLESLGLTERFDCVRCREDVTLGKPAPDVYLAAAACLDVDHECCLALEDSPIGLRSALNAGMRCLVVLNDYFEDSDFSGAEGCYTSLTEVLAALS